MALVPDIAASYRRPVAVQAEKIASGREDLALVYLVLACGMIFVGQWPRLAREAHLTGAELQPMIGGALMAWVFLMPVVLYGLGWLVALGFRAARRPVGAFASRMALFWALVAALPLWLLHALTAAMVGPGPALGIVGALAFGAFAVFWASGLVAARRLASGGAGASGARWT